MPPYITRKRDIPLWYSPPGVSSVWNSGTSPQSACTIVGQQETTSRDNPVWRRSQMKEVRTSKSYERFRQWQYLYGDQGGEFETTKNWYESSHSDQNFAASPTQRGYVGTLEAYYRNIGAASVAWPNVPPLPKSALVALGTKAISLTIPTNPVVSGSVALGEAVQALPRIPGLALSQARGFGKLRSVGDEYLNYQFGIAPTVSDIKKTAQAVKTSSEVIAQMERDSGRLIRRTYKFPLVTNTTITQMGNTYFVPPLTVLHGTGKGALTRTTTTSVRTWFSGAYVYYFNPGKTILGKIKRAEQIANRLYGSRVNLETAWNLAPYSWLADYVFNVGDVIHNATALANDSLVLRYGYLMCESTTSVTYTLVGARCNSLPLPSLSQTFGTTTKQRVRATPYGFGLNSALFSTQQWAILGALGLTKSPGRFRN